MAKTGFKVDLWLSIVSRSTTQLSSDLTQNGQIAYDSTKDKAIVRSNGVNDPVVLEDREATLTNKTLEDAILNNPTIVGGTFDLDGSVIEMADFDGGIATNTSRLTIPKGPKADLVALTRKEATIVYATDEKGVYVDDGSELQAIGRFRVYAPQSLLDGGVISLNINAGFQMRKVVGDGGPVILDVLPLGSSAPKDGILIRIAGQSDVNTVSLISNDASKGLLLNGDCILGQGQSLDLQYDATLDRYIEVSRNSF